MTDQSPPVAVAVKSKVRRRLYSLYPEQIAMLEALAKKRNMPQSQLLRELIEVAWISDKQTSTRYGA